jgi:hypothetical protein
LRDYLEYLRKELAGPRVWGKLNQGQMQCSCCESAYIELEDIINEMDSVIKSEKSNAKESQT